MIKAASILFLILITATGCKESANNVIDERTEAPQKIASYDTLPDTLIGFPRYPEDPEKTTVSEYDNGWEIEIVVPNPYAIARAAWITAFQERLWQLENEIVISQNSFSWVVMRRGEEILFIKIQETSEEESTITTFIKK